MLIDVVTGKNTIQGTYQGLESRSFPYVHPAVVVYIVLTEGNGETALQLRLIDVDEQHPPLFELDAVIDFGDPLEVREAVFHQPKVSFPAPGEYRLQLLAGNTPLMERRLQVVLIEDEE